MSLGSALLLLDPVGRRQITAKHRQLRLAVCHPLTGTADASCLPADHMSNRSNSRTASNQPQRGCKAQAAR